MLSRWRNVPPAHRPAYGPIRLGRWHADGMTSVRATNPFSVSRAFSLMIKKAMAAALGGESGITGPSLEVFASQVGLITP